MRTLNRKHIIYGSLFVLGLATGMLIGGTLYVNDIYSEVKKFRSKPKYSAFDKLFNSTGLNGHLIRAMLFVRGSRVYMREIRDWTYETQRETIGNDFITKAIILDDFGSMSDGEFRNYIRAFPYDIDEITDQIQTRIWSGSVSLFELIEGQPIAGDLAADWVAEFLVSRRDPQLFQKSLKYLSFSENIDYTNLLGSYGAPNGIWMNSVPIPSQSAHSIVSWLDKKTASRTFDFSKFAWFMSKVLKEGNDEEKNTISWVFLENAGYVDREVIGDAFYVSEGIDARFLSEMFMKLRQRSDAIALYMFRRILPHALPAAEFIAEEILKEPDSILRKSVIVWLVRYKSPLGIKYIDEAFSGSAPRHTEFSRVSEYIFGSEAAQKYIELSKHDYQETGKTWPPSYVDGPPSIDETENWTAFIAKYPWFPGTDDAYFRLAYSQYRNRDYIGALRTIREFTRKGKLLDKDAGPALGQIVRRIPLEELPAGEKELRLLVKHFQQMQANILQFAMRQVTSLRDTRNAIWWIKKHSRYAVLLGDIEDIGDYETAINSLERVPRYDKPAAAFAQKLLGYRKQKERKAIYSMIEALPGFLNPADIHWTADVDREDVWRKELHKLGQFVKKHLSEQPEKRQDIRRWYVVWAMFMDQEPRAWGVSREKNKFDEGHEALVSGILREFAADYSQLKRYYGGY